MIMCVLLCYPVSNHMSQLLSTGCLISSCYCTTNVCIVFFIVNVLFKKIIVIKWSDSNFGLYIMFMHYNHRFVRSELDLAFTPERCTYYIQLITDTLWPEGVLDTNVYEPSPEQCKVTREQAKRCLQNFFPGNTVISKIYKMN